MVDCVVFERHHRVIQNLILFEYILSVVKSSCKPSPFRRTKANKHNVDQNKPLWSVWLMADLKSDDIY